MPDEEAAFRVKRSNYNGIHTNHLSYLQEHHPRLLERVAALSARDRVGSGGKRS